MSNLHESDLPEPDAMTIDPTNLGSVDPLSVEGIFLVALGKSGDERKTFLVQKCQDESQRQRVEALLAAYEKAGDFLQKPAVTSEPTPIGQYLSPSDVPGTLGRLGTYDIIEEIGRGGMGVVFRAYDPKLQRIVAIKALAPELARLPSARQRFLREARAAAAISHPHVVTIFAVEGTEEASLGTERTTLPFLVMECIVGQTLHDKIKRVGALKVEEIIRIARQMAEGLAAAHKRGLIHRDIKPANILLENGVERVKITDFGLARTTSDGGITHTGEILGTPQCMSPEQARGEVVDQRSDLFSLGCVLYTMCTGVSPFRSDNILSVMKKVCEETPRPIQQLNPEIPEWLGQLVRQLLQKQPDHRIQSAAEIVQALESRVAVAKNSSADTQQVQALDRSVDDDGPCNSSGSPNTPSPATSLRASASGSITRTTRSPWSILGWMLVGLMGVGALGVLLLIIGLIVPFFLARQSANMEIGRVVLDTHGNKIANITIDGQEVRLQERDVDDSGRPTFMGYTGPRTLEIQYESDNPQEKKFYKSTVNLSRSTTIVDAAPTISPVASTDAEKADLNPPSIQASLNANIRATSSATSRSIALTDSVEVLTDPATMPRYPYMHNSNQTILTHAWVDQPGLVIRLKPLTFEGQESSDVEYVSSCAWGMGYFQHAGDGMQQPVELQAGRYRVLVQDLDYGWELDRRGTITLGRGQQTIQVKRSFAGQQMTPTPEGANFRWAGKTYRLKSANEVNAVNEMLAAMSSEQTEASRYGVAYGPVDWSGHALKEQFVPTDSGSGSGSKPQLRYQPPMMKLEIPAGLNVEHVDITAEQGAAYWNRSVPDGFHVPSGQLHYEVIYQNGFSWTGDSRKVLDLKSLSNQTLVVGPLTRSWMRAIVLSGQRTAGDNGLGFYWFDKDVIYLDKHAVKAAERLILAWLDTEPDVSEAELLQLGKVDSWEKLWSNGQSSLPRSNMTFALIPGKEPGTWRMKEPPAGAVQP